MTINAPASLLLLLYELVGTGQGADPARPARHDPERHPQGVLRAGELHLPAAALHAADDRHVPLRVGAACRASTRSRSPATTSARPARRPSRSWRSRSRTASPTSRRRSPPGSQVDDFAARLSFFFNAHNDVFQEIAKFRAARRLWAHIMRDRFGALDPRSQALRFHAQTGGSTLTAQQPEVNIVRVALQAFSAVAGGCQSLHTNGFDEALALPTEHSATLALRTQQVLAFEAGTTATTDPFGGSYYIEMLTDELERGARALIEEIDGIGGAVAAIEAGVDAGPHRGGGVRVPARHRGRRGRRRRREPLPGRRAGSSPSCTASTRPPSGARPSARRRSARAATPDEAAAQLADVRAAAVASDVNLLEPMRAALADALHDRRDLRRAARGVGHVRRADRRGPIGMRRLWVLAVARAAAARGVRLERRDDRPGRRSARRRPPSPRRRPAWRTAAAIPLPRRMSQYVNIVENDALPELVANPIDSTLPAGRGDADRVGAGVRRGHARRTTRRSTRSARRCAARSSRASRPTRRGRWSATTPASSRPQGLLTVSGLACRAARASCQHARIASRRAIRASSARLNCGGLTPNGAVSGSDPTWNTRESARKTHELTPGAGCTGTIGPPMTDRHAPHTTAERLEHLERLTAKVTTGDQAAIARQRDRGKGTARERIEALFDPGTFTELDRFVQHRNPNFGMLAQAPLRRRRDHRPRPRQRPPRVRLLAGLHRLRRLARRGVRREDLQGDGHGAAVRVAAGRHQRLRRRAHPGGRRLAGRLRRHLRAQRRRVGRDPADLAR